MLGAGPSSQHLAVRWGRWAGRQRLLTYLQLCLLALRDLLSAHGKPQSNGACSISCGDGGRCSYRPWSSCIPDFRPHTSQSQQSFRSEKSHLAFKQQACRAQSYLCSLLSLHEEAQGRADFPRCGWDSRGSETLSLILGSGRARMGVQA